MKQLNDFYHLYESLEKAKKAIEKELDPQGFEIYIDDSNRKKISLVISVDELITNGADYKDVEKAIKSIVKKYRLKEDPMSNHEVVFLTESLIESSIKKGDYVVVNTDNHPDPLNDLGILPDDVYKVKKVNKGTLLISGSDGDFEVPIDSMVKEGAGVMGSKIKKGLVDVSKFLGGDPKVKDELYQVVKNFLISKDVAVFENFKEMHERADSKAQRRLFAIALQFKRGNIDESDLEEEFKEEIIKISKLPEETLRKFAKTKEEGLPHYVGENEDTVNEMTAGSEPMDARTYATFCTITNPAAKAELIKFWKMQGLTDEQAERAYDNVMKVQHFMYNNYFLGHPGRAYIN